MSAVVSFTSIRSFAGIAGVSGQVERKNSRLADDATQLALTGVLISARSAGVLSVANAAVGGAGTTGTGAAGLEEMRHVFEQLIHALPHAHPFLQRGWASMRAAHGEMLASAGDAASAITQTSRAFRMDSLSPLARD